MNEENDDNVSSPRFPPSSLSLSLRSIRHNSSLHTVYVCVPLWVSGEVTPVLQQAGGGERMKQVGAGPMKASIVPGACSAARSQPLGLRPQSGRERAERGAQEVVRAGRTERPETLQCAQLPWPYDAERGEKRKCTVSKPWQRLHIQQTGQGVRTGGHQ